MSDICCKLHLLFDGLPHLSVPFDSKSLPFHGIYVLFEDGEKGHVTNNELVDLAERLGK